MDRKQSYYGQFLLFYLFIFFGLLFQVVFLPLEPSPQPLHLKLFNILCFNFTKEQILQSVESSATQSLANYTASTLQ
jgi:hypothetical protein